jgi:hypothetical protein
MIFELKLNVVMKKCIFMKMKGKRKMTPYEIELLLHYYARKDFWYNSSKPIFAQTIRKFKLNRLIVEIDGKYFITLRGECMVKMLMEISLPILAWTNPITKEIIDYEKD